MNDQRKTSEVQLATRNEESRFSIAVVIPAFNAEDTVAEVVEDFAEVVRWVIVVDDGSSDATADQLESLATPNLVILRHERNQGVGAATKLGIREAFDL